MSIYLIMAFGGLIGIILHALIVIRNINKRINAVNFKTVFDEYMKTEWLSLLFSFVAFGALLYVASEFVDLKKLDNYTTAPLKDRLVNFRIANFIKLSSVLAGYFADSIVYGFLGLTEKKLNKKIQAAQEAEDDNQTKN